MGLLQDEDFVFDDQYVGQKGVFLFPLEDPNTGDPIFNKTCNSEGELSQKFRRYSGVVGPYIPSPRLNGLARSINVAMEERNKVVSFRSIEAGKVTEPPATHYE